MENLKDTVAVLPDNCLRAIFLCLPILQRIKLREVCKRWRKISDDCWRHIRVIIVTNPISWFNQVHGYGVSIEIRAVNDEFANGFIKRCARYVIVVKDRRASQTFSILPALKSCRKIEKLEITLNSLEDDQRLFHLLTTNRQIRCLQIIVVKEDIHTYDCLSQLCTEFLEELSILIDGYLESEDGALLMNVKRLIDRCRRLNKLTIQVEGDEVLETIGDCGNLEYLDIKVFNGTANKLHNIAKLCKLRSLEMHSYACEAMISDILLEDISENCVQLEFVSLFQCQEVTDRALVALSRLPKLKILNINGAPKIADDYLACLSNVEKLLISGSSISDLGIIALLRSSPRLNFLNLKDTKMTIASVKVAIEEIKKRKNGVPLNLCLTGTGIKVCELREIPPLLHIL